MKVILVTGLSGSGKTTFAKKLYEKVKTTSPYRNRDGEVIHYHNGDELRGGEGDHDFSMEGRIRNARRFEECIEFDRYNQIHCICDTICPTQSLRDILKPDIIIWMNTVQSSEYPDTDAIYEPPANPYKIITSLDEVDPFIEEFSTYLINELGASLGLI